MNKLWSLVADPENEVHWGRCAAEGAKAGSALGAMTVAVKRHLRHGFRDRDGGAGKSARLNLAVEFLRCGARKPVEFELFGFGKLGSEVGVGPGKAFFLLVDEGLTEGEEKPIAVGDEDVMEEFAEFRIAGGC